MVLSPLIASNLKAILIEVINTHDTMNLPKKERKKTIAHQETFQITEAPTCRCNTEKLIWKHREGFQEISVMKE